MDIRGMSVRKSTLGGGENVRMKAWLYVGEISCPVTLQLTPQFSCMEPTVQQERDWTAEGDIEI